MKPQTYEMYESARDYILIIMEREKRNLRDKKIKGVIDLILWRVASKDGILHANALIAQFELHRPYHGSHVWFDDDVERLPVIHLDPTMTVPDEDKIFPNEEKFPNKEPEYVATNKNLNWVSDGDTFGSKNQMRIRAAMRKNKK